MWVDKTVRVCAATTCRGLCQHSQTLKAKPGVAVSAEHLVALQMLCFLFLEILLAQPHSASWALHGPCLLKPLPDACIIITLSTGSPKLRLLKGLTS
jgi:hypothetical protein